MDYKITPFISIEYWDEVENETRHYKREVLYADCEFYCAHFWEIFPDGETYEIAHYLERKYYPLEEDGRPPKKFRDIARKAFNRIHWKDLHI